MRRKALKASLRYRPGLETCEERVLTALVFVLNGNAYSEAVPNALTANAASVLRAAGHQVVQLAYPTVATPRAFMGIANRIASMSRGQPIGLVGFSAGGTLAARLSSIASLNVVAVMNNYGPPDLRNWFQIHGSDFFARYVRSRVPFTSQTIDLLSGPSSSKAHVVSVFGMQDRNVLADSSRETMESEFPGSKVYTYPGGHGAPITVCPPALEDFLAHLPMTSTPFLRPRFRRRV